MPEILFTQLLYFCELDQFDVGSLEKLSMSVVRQAKKIAEARNGYRISQIDNCYVSHLRSLDYAI